MRCKHSDLNLLQSPDIYIEGNYHFLRYPNFAWELDNVMDDVMARYNVRREKIFWDYDKGWYQLSFRTIG